MCIYIHTYIYIYIYRSFATTVSQLKMCDSSGETFKDFEVLKCSMSATTTQLPPQTGSFEKCIMTLYLLEVDLQTFLSITVTQKCHPHRTHDLRSRSQDHHPSKNSVQKTIFCNSTSNAPEDGRMCLKHVELRTHQ